MTEKLFVVKEILKQLEIAKKNELLLIWQVKNGFEYVGTEYWGVKMLSTAGHWASKKELRAELVRIFGVNPQDAPEHKVILHIGQRSLSNVDMASVFSGVNSAHLVDAQITAVCINTSSQNRPTKNAVVGRITRVDVNTHDKFTCIQESFTTMTEYRIGKSQGVRQPLVFGDANSEALIILPMRPAVTGTSWWMRLQEELGL